MEDTGVCRNEHGLIWMIHKGNLCVKTPMGQRFNAKVTIDSYKPMVGVKHGIGNIVLPFNEIKVDNFEDAIFQRKNGDIHLIYNDEEIAVLNGLFDISIDYVKEIDGIPTIFIGMGDL